MSFTYQRLIFVTHSAFCHLVLLYPSCRTSKRGLLLDIAHTRLYVCPPHLPGPHTHTPSAGALPTQSALIFLTEDQPWANWSMSLPLSTQLERESCCSIQRPLLESVEVWVSGIRGKEQIISNALCCICIFSWEINRDLGWDQSRFSFVPGFTIWIKPFIHSVPQFPYL